MLVRTICGAVSVPVRVTRRPAVVVLSADSPAVAAIPRAGIPVVACAEPIPQAIASPAATRPTKARAARRPDVWPGRTVCLCGGILRSPWCNIGFPSLGTDTGRPRGAAAAHA